MLLLWQITLSPCKGNHERHASKSKAFAERCMNRVIEEKDAEIARLQELISSGTQIRTAAAWDTLSEENALLSELEAVFQGYRVKQSQLTLSKAATLNLRLDDWLIPPLEQAANWNGWSDDKKLIQLAGHLHGKVAHEYMVFYLQRKNIPHHSCIGTSSLVGPRQLCNGSSKIWECTTLCERKCVTLYITRLEGLF